jgi:hypothetical protein
MLKTYDDETERACGLHRHRPIPRFGINADRLRKDRPTLPGSVAVHTNLTTRFLRKIGAKGGENSRKYLGKRLVKQLARKAANARWKNGTS